MIHLSTTLTTNWHAKGHVHQSTIRTYIQFASVKHRGAGLALFPLKRLKGSEKERKRERERERVYERVAYNKRDKKRQIAGTF